jgi:uncharacterized protein
MTQIPLFPLPLLPLPDELVTLHIFEPRYRQLLSDAETKDVRFGIYCNHELNKERLGSVMRLESVIKKYPGGEADIVARCVDIFTLEKMFRTFKTKLYPGGDVSIWNVDTTAIADSILYELFLEYQGKRNIRHRFTVFTMYQMAGELNLDLFDRYKFLTSGEERRAKFLTSQLKFQLHLLLREEQMKDSYHLN